MPDTLAAELGALSRRLSSASDDAKRSLTRIVSEMDFTNRLRELHPEKRDAWEKLIERALSIVTKTVESGKLDGLKAAVAEAEEVLGPVAETAKSYTVWNAGHGHIDMNWMWSWPETVSVTIDTFSTVLRLMDAYPEFCYSQSQASVYEIVRQHDPALFEKIKKRVAEGRWEVTASNWVEGDKNLAGGESLCRHLLYTRRYMEEHLGLKPEDVPIDWSPDTFGHAHTVPSFLARGGVRRYYHCRSGIDQQRPAVFWWRGPDGSRVLVYKEVSYSWYNGRIEPSLITPMVNFCKETGLREWLNVYGVGDHGGGPTRADIERCGEMNGWPVFPKWALSPTKPFYETLERNGEKWPVLDKELNYEFMGCYTTQTRIKKANRVSEQLLYQTEAAATLAWALEGRSYPGDRLREGWINTLFSQFHDILPGSGVRETREYCMGQFQETMARTGSITAGSLRSLAGQVDTKAMAGNGSSALPGSAVGSGAGYESGLGGVSSADGAADEVRPYLVFNLNGWERSGVVEATLWDTGWDKNRIVIEGESGEKCAAQVVDEGHYWGHTFLTVAFPTGPVPSMGYRTFLAREADAEVAPSALSHPGRGVVENEFVRVEMDWNTGGIKHLVDKESGVDLADPAKPMGIFEYAVERAHGMTAWVIGDIMNGTMLTDLDSLDEKRGPYKTTFTGRLRIGSSKLTTTIIVRAGEPTVELSLYADWFERGTKETGVPMLRMHVPVNLEDRSARYEIPYGTITRELADGEEVPSQRFADLSGKSGWKSAGLTVVNDCKYGHSLDGNDLRITLIRSSYDPDILPEIGEHTMRIGLVPHGGGWSEADGIRAGVNFGQPLVVVGTDVHEGKLPASASYLSVDAANVILCAVKKAEDSDAVILRFYETGGKDTTATVTLGDGLAAKNATEVDLLERPTAENGATVKDGKLSVSVPGHGIVSVRVRSAFRS